MTNTSQVFIGIDPTAGRNPYTWAVLNSDCELQTLGGGELDELINLVGLFSSSVVAVNSPQRPNNGLVRQNFKDRNLSGQLRGVEMRLCEYQLRERGISVPPTAGRMDACASWTRMGFMVHKKLAELGFTTSVKADLIRCSIETNPHAIFCALLGQVPLPKPSLEGRIQRQLVLHSNGAGISDPMDFFEEITRHKLMRGQLPMQFIHAPEELDTIASALTAWMLINQPEDVYHIGDPQEGQITLPVRTVLEKY